MADDDRDRDDDDNNSEGSVDEDTINGRTNDDRVGVALPGKRSFRSVCALSVLEEDCRLTVASTDFFKSCKSSAE